MQRIRQPQTPVPVPHFTRVLRQKADGAQHGANHHPARKRVVHPTQPLHHRRQPHPDGGVHIVGFGVVIGVGQRGVKVVLQVGVFEPQIADENRQRRKHQRFVQPLGFERVAVNDLVLQGSVQGHAKARQDQRQQRRAGPQPQAQAPNRIASCQHRQRWPLYFANLVQFGPHQTCSDRLTTCLVVPELGRYAR